MQPFAAWKAARLTLATPCDCPSGLSKVAWQRQPGAPASLPAFSLMQPFATWKAARLTLATPCDCLYGKLGKICAFCYNS
jgi:hypothetical protein